jgi:small subunit ribosomal protein S2
VIPGNDDAIRAIKLYVTAVADACIEGRVGRHGIVPADEFVEKRPARGAEQGQG